MDKRLENLGCAFPTPIAANATAWAKPLDMVWLDVGYGGKNAKTLGGAVGRVQLSGGQFVQVGENTRFGFGRYIIEEPKIDIASI